MRILVTTGPTREPIDTVRFISNASSGRMGLAVAAAAARKGHDVTLLAGEGVPLPPDAPRRTVRFGSVADLKQLLTEHFGACDVLVMAAAVGDFRVEKPFPAKLHRRGGPVTLKLFPTEDLLAGLKAVRRADQRIVAFAVEAGPREQVEAKARKEMAAKGADFVVVNTPAAMGAEESEACILSPKGVVLPWAVRPKEALAEEILRAIDAIME